jgi:hypothetical protein
MGKLAKMLLRRFIVGSGCLLDGTEKTQVSTLTAGSYISLPLFAMFVPRYSFESAGVARTPFAVHVILRVIAFAQILSAVVQRVMVPMVAFFILVTRQNYLMHSSSFSANASNSVKTFSICIPFRTPNELGQPRKISGIDDGVLALRERYQSVGLVERMNNRMAFHAGHRSSEKGLLLFSRQFYQISVGMA